MDAASATGTQSSASRALRDESSLFGLVVDYADLGGCRTMIGNTGAPPGLEAALALPCPLLERAAASFAQATSRSDAAALVRAGRQARSARRLIARALAALREA